MTDAAMQKKTIELGRDVFKDHIAEYKHIGENFDVLDFRKPGTICYSFRMVFDREYGNAAYISGDMGEAVIYPTCDCTLEGFAKCFTYRNKMGDLDFNEPYFMEKIRAISDGKYEYDLDDFKEDLKDRFDEHGVIEEWDYFEEEYLDSFADHVSVYPDSLIAVDSDTTEWLGDHGIGCEDLYQCGRRINQRIILWLVAIRLAWEQIQAKERHEDNS